MVTKADASDTVPEGLEGDLANLKKWLEANPPKTFKIHPDEDPITKKQVMAGGKAAVEAPEAAANGGR